MSLEPLPSVKVYGEGLKAVALRGQLMVYRKWVRTPQGLEPGQLVVVEAAKGDIVGCGFYDTVGPVALRLVEVGNCSYVKPEEAIRDIVMRAYAVRRRLGYTCCSDSGFRLLHSDGDMAPGLIVDVYADIAVFQSSSIVWDIHSKTLVEALTEIVGVSTVYEKSTQRTRRDIGLPPREKHHKGSKTRTVIREGEAQFLVDVRLGQKTGFFLDQRLNRIEFGRLANGIVLDLFSYTGGFGIHALVNGAEKAVFVEVDERALSILKENLNLNRVSSRAVIIADNVWEFLRRNRGKFSSVAVDPPAFIPDIRVKSRGLRGYFNLYTEAAKRVENGGLLFVSSCSTHLSRQEFLEVVARALARAGRSYRSLGSVRGLPPDHALRPGAEHLDYLKSLFLILH